MLTARVAATWHRIVELADDLFAPVMIGIVVARVVMAVSPSMRMTEHDAVVMREMPPMHEMRSMPAMHDVNVDVDVDTDADVDVEMPDPMPADAAPCDSMSDEEMSHMTSHTVVRTIVRPVIMPRVRVVVVNGT